MPGIQDFVQEHPIVLVGGAAAIGLVIFMGGKGNQNAPAAQSGLTPTPVTPPAQNPNYLTADQFNMALQQYDLQIQQEIANFQQQGQQPPPLPPPPQGQQCPPGYGWSPTRQACISYTEPGQPPQQPPPSPVCTQQPYQCFIGWHWDTSQCKCVPN